MWLFIILIAIGVARGVKVYRDALQEKRTACLNIIMDQGLDLDNLEVKALYAEITLTNWLPRLDELTILLKQMAVRLAKQRPKNPESGSYMDYIQRHQLPFDAREALEWQARASRHR